MSFSFAVFDTWLITFLGALDWSAEPTPAVGDWSAEPAAGTGGWGVDEATGWN